MEKVVRVEFPSLPAADGSENNRVLFGLYDEDGIREYLYETEEVAHRHKHCGTSRLMAFDVDLALQFEEAKVIDIESGQQLDIVNASFVSSIVDVPDGLFAHIKELAESR